MRLICCCRATYGICHDRLFLCGLRGLLVGEGGRKLLMLFLSILMWTTLPQLRGFMMALVGFAVAFSLCFPPRFVLRIPKVSYAGSSMAWDTIWLRTNSEIRTVIGEYTPSRCV
jgi:hypothetical protein